MFSNDDEEEEKEDYVGRTVKKFFAGFGYFYGKVISFNRLRSFYKVKYEDGDREELELEELKKVLVEKNELQRTQKSEGKRGRKRRRGSPDQIERSPPAPVDNAHSEGAKKLVYNAVPDKKGKELHFRGLQDAETQKKVAKVKRNEALGEREKLEDEQLVDPLIPISLPGVFDNRTVELDRLSRRAAQERDRKKTVESATPPSITTPPRRLKRTRVTPSSSSCLLQAKAGGQQLNPVEDAKVGREMDVVAGTSECHVKLSSPSGLEGAELPQRDVDSKLYIGVESHAAEERENAAQRSLLLSLPPSSKSLGAVDYCAADLFKVYGILRSFSDVIFLSPFSLEEFVFTLGLTDVSSMIDCIHLTLLQTLRRQLERLSRNGSKSATFTLRLADWSLLDNITWPSFLASYLLTQGFEFAHGRTSLKAGLSADEYYKLSVGTKLTLLSFLCDKVLDTEEARAELSRRAILENDPEGLQSNDCIHKEPENKLEDLSEDFEVEIAGPQFTCLGKDEVDVMEGVAGQSTPSAANSIRVGRHLDEDGNLDECVLCAMDGNLICCDGCPAAYHSRCVGVTRQGLPPGEWFCPECKADKQDRRGARISKGVRGGELLRVGSDYLFFSTCGYLLISESSSEREAVHRYYSPHDLHSVMQSLDEACPIYAHFQTALQQLCHSEASFTVSPAATRKGSLAGDPPEGHQEVHGRRSDVGGDLCINGGTSCPVLSISSPDVTKTVALQNANTSVELRGGENQMDFALSPLEKNRQNLNSHDYSLRRISDISSDCPILKEEEAPCLPADGPLDLVNAVEPCSFTVECTSTALNRTCNLHASDDSKTQTFMTSAKADEVRSAEVKNEHTLGKSPDTRIKNNGRNPEKEEDYLSTLTQINAYAYTNKYANSDFVATAAFNLAVMAGGVDDLVDDRGGNHRRAKPSSLADQVKAFTQASGHFSWPSVKKRMMDFPKEKCGWCINCRSTIRRSCLLTQVVGKMAGGAALAVGGIRPIKGGFGHYPAVAAYILYMEDSLHGLLGGPWDLSGHRKLWRKCVEQVNSLQDVKSSLLEMESSLRGVALLPDWVKAEEDAPESISNTDIIVSGLVGKKAYSKKRGRSSIIPKGPVVGSYDGACFGVYWWRGGIMSRQVYHWESLPRMAIKRAGRRGAKPEHVEELGTENVEDVRRREVGRKSVAAGGFKEIPELLYSRNSDLPRRTRQFAWRTRVEKISTIAQLALEVRYLDTFIRWNDIISPLEASTTRNVKGLAKSDPAFSKAEILSKAEECGRVKYLLAFPENPDNKDTSPSQCLETSSRCSSPSEELSNKKRKGVSNGVWVRESEVPLFLLKDFEEKSRLTSKVPKPLKTTKMLSLSRPKKSSFWKMCNSRFAGMLASKTMASWSCAHCNLSCTESQAVQCRRCNGKFHRNCTEDEDSTKGHWEVPVCKGCIKLRLGQRMRKPSYKMLALQSQHADGTAAVCSRDAVLLNSLDGASRSAKLRQKKCSPNASATHHQYDLFVNQTKSLLSVATPSLLDRSPEKAKSGKKRGRPCKTVILEGVGSQPEGDLLEVGNGQPSTKNLSAGACDPSQPKKRGRKMKSASLGISQSQGELDILTAERQISGRKRNSISHNGNMESEDQRGRSETGAKLDTEMLLTSNVSELGHETFLVTRRRSERPKKMFPAAADVTLHDQESSQTDKKESPLRPTRLKIIFSGLGTAQQGGNVVDGHAQTKTRKSGYGLDYGSRSARPESEIQRFRQERLIVADQVRFSPGAGPVCCLCAGRYLPGQMFVGCEYCKEWFHGVAVGVEPEDAPFLLGFKCHKCRKCRAPYCPMNCNSEVKTKRRGDVDHGEVIDAEKFNATVHFEPVSPLRSSPLNTRDEHFSIFQEAKLFPGVVCPTNEADAPLAVDSNNFNVLAQDIDVSGLVLSDNPQFQLASGFLAEQQVNIWASSGPMQLDLPDLSSGAIAALSFTELLASEEDCLTMTNTGLGLGPADWAAGTLGSSSLPPSIPAGVNECAALSKQ